MTAPDSLDGTDPLLRGVGLDAQTRCAHYATARDVVALRFACCPAYWSCHRCHAELADHPAVPVPAGDFDRPHVLCGVCRTELSVAAYLALEATDGVKEALHLVAREKVGHGIITAAVPVVRLTQ